MATPVIGLPELEAAQGQKYLTVNQTFRRLDVLVNLTVFNRTVTSPPGSPSEGHRYIVGSPATGGFTGQENNIAAFIGAAWVFFTPSEGWRAYDQGANQFIIFDGSSWVLAGISAGSLTDGSLGQLGVNATPDSTNRFAVNSAGVVFNRETDDVEVIINKEATGDEGQVRFTTGWGTKAILGLLGDDDFTITVSNDGSSFHQALVIDKDTGNVAIGAGSDANNKLLVSGESMLFTNSGDLRFTFNKGSASDDVALTFQSGFSARALVGLLGSDDFIFSVSPDGSTYHQAIVIDKDNGTIAFPSMTKFSAFINYDHYAALTWVNTDINNDDLNVGSAFSGGVFTAPVTGIYRIGYSLGYVQNGTNNPTSMQGRLLVNGTTPLLPGASRSSNNAVDSGTIIVCVEGLVPLTSGDTVRLQHQFTSLDGYAASNITRFWGELISA